MKLDATKSRMGYEDTSDERLAYENLCAKYGIKKTVVIKDKLAKLKSAVNNIFEQNPAFDKKCVSDSLLERFLLFHGTVKKAAPAIERFLKWRIDENVDRINDEDLDVIKEVKVGRHTLVESMKDRCGRPLVVIHARLHNKYKSEERAMWKYMIYFMEMLSRLSNESEMKNFCCIFDLKEFSRSTMDYRLVKKLIFLLQNCYPELLGTALIINYPLIFSGFWKVIRIWMSESVRSKFIFAGENEVNDFIDLKMLPIPIFRD